MEKQAQAPKAESKTKKILIETKGEVEYKFRELITNVKEIRFKSIYLHNSYFNVSSRLNNNKVQIHLDGEGTGNDNKTINITLDEGFFDVKELEESINNWISTYPNDLRDKVKFKLNYDSNSKKITFEVIHLKDDFKEYFFFIKSNVLKLLGFVNGLALANIDGRVYSSDYSIKLFPFSKYYVHCNLLSDREYNGKNSDIVCILPIDETKKWWDTVSYRNLDCSFKPEENYFNSLKLWITDENNNIIDFHGYPILYELEIIQQIIPNQRANEDLNFIATKIANRIKEITNEENNKLLD